MAHFKPYGEFKVSEYYGVSLMKIKKNGHYSIKLVYDYKDRALVSANALDTDSLDKAVEIYKLLDSKSKDKTDKFSLDEIMKITNEEDEAWK
jgi:hypothetical protein